MKKNVEIAKLLYFNYNLIRIILKKSAQALGEILERNKKIVENCRFVRTKLVYLIFQKN